MDSDLTPLIKALSDLEQSANFAQKYGPYFFALVLLVVAPFVCRAVFSNSIDKAPDLDVRAKAYDDFRYYFRHTVQLGIFCVLAGVGWWLFDSYKEDTRTGASISELKARLADMDSMRKNMSYAAYGMISTGLKPKDMLFSSVNPTAQIVFTKVPVTDPNSDATWFFVLLSDKALPPLLETNVFWSPQGDGNNPSHGLVPMPVRVTFGKNNSSYQFSLDADFASVKPIGGIN